MRFPLPLGLLALTALWVGIGSGAPLAAAPAPAVVPDPALGWKMIPATTAAEQAETDGRFLVVVGAKNDSVAGTEGGQGRTLLELWWPAEATTARIAVFDADTSGLWDERSGPGEDVLVAPDTRYELFSDVDLDAAARLQDGNPANDPVPLATRRASEVEIAQTDAAWLQLFTRDLGADPLAVDGFHRYVLRVTLESDLPDAFRGREVNGFKVAYDGEARVSADSVIGIAGGAVDSRITVNEAGHFEESSADIPPIGPTTTYAGVFEFPFESSAVCGLETVTFYEADADWNEVIPPGEAAMDPQGLPPDDGGLYRDARDAAGLLRDSTGLKVSPQILWEIVSPSGVVVFSSNANTALGHASSNADVSEAQPFVATNLDPAPFLATPGTWKLRWRGVDKRNFVFWRMNIPVGDTPPVTCPLRGTVACVADATPIPGATVTATRVGEAVALATATTDPTGAYQMDLPAGAFVVRVTAASLGAGVILTPVGATEVNVTIGSVACECPDVVADFGYDCCVQPVLRARVLCDDGDGVVDASDLPIAGVAVQVATTVGPIGVVTGADGTVTVPLPGADAVTVSVDPAQPALAGKPALLPTSVPVLVECGDQPEVAFLFDCTPPCDPAQVTGRVYCDEDGSGSYTAGDRTFADVLVAVTPTDGSLPVSVAVTGPDGRFTATGLEAGEWTFSVDTSSPVLVEAGAVLQGSPDAVVEAACGGAYDIGFRFLCAPPCEPGRVAGRVYCDEDGSGSYTAGDRTFSGVAVAVTPTDGSLPVSVAVTGPDGRFSAGGLEAGEWTFSVDTASSVLVEAGAVLQGSPDVAVQVICDGVYEIGFRFLCTPPCDPGQVTGRVYCDEDGSGSYTAGDRTFAGVAVTVLPGDGSLPVSVAVTGPDGRFAASGLAAGAWTFAVDTESPVLVEAGATPAGPVEVTVQVDCGGTYDASFRFSCACTCPEQSTDCEGGYHLVETVVDVTVTQPVETCWTNPASWGCGKSGDSRKAASKGRGKGRGDDRKSADRWGWKRWDRDDRRGDCRPEPVDCRRHEVIVTAGGRTVRIEFSGDQWHGSKSSGLLTVLGVWRVQGCQWQAKVRLEACDRSETERGCLPKWVCVRVRIDTACESVALDLSCQRGPLPLGVVTDSCGNPSYTVLRWLSCRDARCCPPHLCCSPCEKTCTPCGCARD